MAGRYLSRENDLCYVMSIDFSILVSEQPGGRMRVLFLTAMMALFSGTAWAQNPATIEFGCAPWDGKALRIKVAAADAVYSATLWENGMRALESVAHATTVDNKLDKDGTGTGTVCLTGADGQTKCTQEALRVEVKTADFKSGSIVSGSIIFKDSPVSFIGTVAAHRGTCG